MNEPSYAFMTVMKRRLFLVWKRWRTLVY